MDITKWLQTGAVIGAMIFAPAIGMAARAQSCAAGPATAESYTWNFHREANHLLKDMRNDARAVNSNADKLEGFAMNTNISWQIQADYLTRIKARVDDMGKRLCRLEEIKRVATPEEQAAIHQVHPLVQYMADNTDAAINYTNTYQNNFWTPSYRTYVQNLAHESHMLRNKVHQEELGELLTPTPSNGFGS
jgi:hypothetical protein